MKKNILLLTALTSLFLAILPSNSAEAYWGRRGYWGKPYRAKWSASLSGGLHFLDTSTQHDSVGALNYGIVEAGAHYWIHPNLSLDLGVGTHLLIQETEDHRGYYNEALWGYFSFKPGVRARVGWFYFRGAVDLSFGKTRLSSGKEGIKTVLFGLLVGVGIRVPVARRMRVFAELDYQFLFSPSPVYMPFYGKAGFEFMF